MCHPNDDSLVLLGGLTFTALLSLGVYAFYKRITSTSLESEDQADPEGLTTEFPDQVDPVPLTIIGREFKYLDREIFEL